MIGILIVSHGRLADALISSVQSLVGNLPRVSGVSIWPKDREKEIKNKIQHKIAEVDDGDGVVILTDIFGGTPTNASFSLSRKEKVQVVTGVNMPMLLTLSSYRQGKSLEEIAELAKKSGRRSIILARKVNGSVGLKRRGKAD
jgi:PTS system mannose-specific IIA component